nr:MAG TPA: hypothetical protein [Caudoviricetes sp.]
MVVFQHFQKNSNLSSLCSPMYWTANNRNLIF